jgi:glyoxylase-like metal-dependent hydrolase (beta-lactamase superfamily II)
MLPRRALPVLFGLALALALVSARGREGQQEGEKEGQEEGQKVQAQPVAGQVAVLFGEGGNIGVSSGPDGVLLVDAQFERLAPEIEKALARLAGDPARARPRFLVSTHHHGDHTDGNKHFGRAAVIAAHENVRAWLQEAGVPAQSLPVVTYTEGLALHWNGEEIRLIHVPGAHTDGDSVAWFTGSNAVHLGDLYFQVGYPFVDTRSGGSVLGLIEGLRGLLPRLPDDVRVIPGHGTVTGKGELEEYVAMLETITDRVREQLASGKDVPAMLAAGITRDFDERWGRFEFVPPQRFLESVVASLR